MIGCICEDVNDFSDKGAMIMPEYGRTDGRDWTLAFVVWGGGAWIIMKVWDWSGQISGGWGTLTDLIIYLIAFFYVFALPFLKFRISRFFNKHADIIS